MAPGFERVKDAFEDNFRSGWDSKGAAFSVYKDGRLLADLHGGFANTETLHEWEENTLANVFSCGKGVVAVAVAMLVDRYKRMGGWIEGRYGQTKAPTPGMGRNELG